MLDDGVCFEGEARGAAREAAGEVVFTTGMAGYQETLSDPSYLGQIVSFTSAHVGNYGVSPLDDESARFRAAGAVFHDLFTAAEGIPFPHWRAEESLDARLARQCVTAIAGLDTRALTLHLREHGARGGIISSLDLDRPSLLRRAGEIPPMQGQDLAVTAGCRQSYEFSPPLSSRPSHGNRPLMRVAVLDFGVKRSILVHLARQGMAVKIWPAVTSAADILADAPDGVLLPNGPGDPEPCVQAVNVIRDLLGRVPLFGICLGHQLLGLALGGRTYKLPFGHHGVNHPVLDLSTRRVLITSQNHGFCLDPDSLPSRAAPSHWNLNDHTLEGMVVKDAPAFSVQFHPEAVPGPTEAGILFERFRDLILNAR
ncbi:MAG: glutamine-hydrolyzing carbamoyl-phosphate synthase small subunit [Desulfovibrio sp.]|nr:glutamine-hydrolyzing carbamoyl-phosphate synthase small subunit [Desulfovibrio sp.]